MPVDEAQRLQAIDATQSFIVQAPAGSGKTELLIQRYLALLARVDTPESIVAITFTRKAAAEMSGRVMKALRDAAEVRPAESEHEKRTRSLATEALRRDADAGWSLLENPARLQIQTIDSLCVRIVSGMPWLARLGALPGFTEQPDPLYREAARATVRMQDDAVAALLIHRDNRADDVISLVAELLGRREQWLRWSEIVRRDPVAARAEFEQRLQDGSLNCLETLSGGYPRDLRAATGKLAGLAHFPGARLEDIPAWEQIAEKLLTGDGKWRKSKAASSLTAALTRQDELLEAFSNLRGLPPCSFSDEQWAILIASLNVLRTAAAQLKMIFREHGEIDFTELSHCASEALGETDQPTDLGLALGYKIEHLLLDEFQDTSRAQFDLIRRITAGWYPGDGRTLFLVGDPMQSIYRFRQAEVGLFEEARTSGIGDMRLTPLTLSANFRSGPQLVSWVNGVFQDIMPSNVDLRHGAVPFAPSEAEKEALDSRVFIHGFRDDHSGASQAACMLATIRATPEDRRIGVLARTRDNLAAIVGLLRTQGIAFQAVELDSLAQRPAIEDLLSLTFALLHPSDRISWLAILRAPWCGLNLDDLERIAGPDRKRPVWELLRNNLMLLSPGGGIRAERVRAILERALEQRGRRELRALVEDAWRALGGPRCVETIADLDDADAFFDLLESLEAGGALEDFQLLRDSVAALFARPDPNASEHIQLMTIHKAKGLEFDVVILPEMHRQGRRGDQSLVAWMDGEGGVLAAPIPASEEDEEPIYKYVIRSEYPKEQNEVRRLLYVAATRARRELHLLGSANSRKNDPADLNKPASNSFLGILWPYIEPDFRASLPPSALASATEAAASFRPLRRVLESWTTPPFTQAVEWAGSSTPSLSEGDEITFDWVGDTLRHAGVVLHGFLQRIGREGLHQWNVAALDRYHSAFRAALGNRGVPEDEMEDAVARVEKALGQCLADSRGRWILEPHREAQCEFALAGVVDGRVVEARIDRTFVDAKGVRWIIDYKTSSHSGGKREQFLDTERERYRDQLERYASIVALDDARPIKLGLYFPLLNGWREWDAPHATKRSAVQGSLFE